MLKRYRASASYGSLNNSCSPYTIAITDNSKFNPEKIADIYVDRFRETGIYGRRLLGGEDRNRRTDGKKNIENGNQRKQTCQSAECSTCGV